ncbi:unnamed protein product [Diplocarpon coronariae]
MSSFIVEAKANNDQLLGFGLEGSLDVNKADMIARHLNFQLDCEASTTKPRHPGNNHGALQLGEAHTRTVAGMSSSLSRVIPTRMSTYEEEGGSSALPEGLQEHVPLNETSTKELVPDSQLIRSLQQQNEKLRRDIKTSNTQLSLIRSQKTAAAAAHKIELEKSILQQTKMASRAKKNTYDLISNHEAEIKSMNKQLEDAGKEITAANLAVETLSKDLNVEKRKVKNLTASLLAIQLQVEKVDQIFGAPTLNANEAGNMPKDPQWYGERMLDWASRMCETGLQYEGLIEHVREYEESSAQENQTIRAKSFLEQRRYLEDCLYAIFGVFEISPSDTCRQYAKRKATETIAAQMAKHFSPDDLKSLVLREVAGIEEVVEVKTAVAAGTPRDPAATTQLQDTPSKVQNSSAKGHLTVTSTETQAKETPNLPQGTTSRSRNVSAKNPPAVVVAKSQASQTPDQVKATPSEVQSASSETTRSTTPAQPSATKASTQSQETHSKEDGKSKTPRTSAGPNPNQSKHTPNMVTLRTAPAQSQVGKKCVHTQGSPSRGNASSTPTAARAPAKVNAVNHDEHHRAAEYAASCIAHDYTLSGRKPSEAHELVARHKLDGKLVESSEISKMLKKKGTDEACRLFKELVKAKLEYHNECKKSQALDDKLSKTRQILRDANTKCPNDMRSPHKADSSCPSCAQLMKMYDELELKNQNFFGTDTHASAINRNPEEKCKGCVQLQEQLKAAKKEICDLKPAVQLGILVRLNFMDRVRAAVQGVERSEFARREMLRAITANGILDDWVLDRINTEEYKEDRPMRDLAGMFVHIYGCGPGGEYASLPEMVRATIECRANVLFAEDLPETSEVDVLRAAHEKLCQKLMSRYSKFLAGKTPLFEANPNHWFLLDRLEWLTDEILEFEEATSWETFVQFMEKDGMNPKVDIPLNRRAEKENTEFGFVVELDQRKLVNPTHTMMPHDMEPSDLVPVRNALTRLEYVEETALQPSTSFRAVMLRLEYQLQELKTDIAEENEEWLEDVKSLEQANQLLRAKNEDLEEQVKHIRANFDTRTVMAKRLHAENEDNFAEMLYLQGVESGSRQWRKIARQNRAKVENSDEVKHNYVLDQRVEELLGLSEVMEARYKIATDQTIELKTEIYNLKRQIQAARTAAQSPEVDNKIAYEMSNLKAQIRDLQSAQAINQYFTYVGALGRKIFVLVGGGALDHTDASLEGQPYRITKEPIVVADEALFKMGILSEETDGSIFRERYGSPYLPALDYAAYTRFYEIKDLKARLNAWLAPEYPGTRGEK